MNWFRTRRMKRQQLRNQEAKRRGYGWAWAAYRIEGKCLEEIEAYLWRPEGVSTSEQMFDLGAELALDDMRRFETVKLLIGEPGK